MAANLARLSDARNAESRYALALVYSEGGKWKRSLPLIEEAIQITSSDSRYNHVPHRFLRLKADCLYGRGEWKAAGAAYRKALDVPSDTGYAEALLGVARSEYRTGRWKEAVEFSRHAVREQESRLESYFRWAQAAAAGGIPPRRRAAPSSAASRRCSRPPSSWLWCGSFLAFPIRGYR